MNTDGNIGVGVVSPAVQLQMLLEILELLIGNYSLH